MTCDNPQMESILKTICTEGIPNRMSTHEGKLLKHFNSAQDGKSVSFSFPVKVNMKTGEVEVDMKFSNIHSDPITFLMDDPNQPHLPGTEVGE